MRASELTRIKDAGAINRPLPLLHIVRMWVFVRMVRPMVMHMSVHRTGGWQFVCLMGMSPLKMLYMVMPAPYLLWIKISDQQAFAVMPAVTENVVILLAPGRALILAQAIPFAMWMLLDTLHNNRSCHRPIACCLEEETEVDVH